MAVVALHGVCSTQWAWKLGIFPRPGFVVGFGSLRMGHGCGIEEMRI